MDTIPDLPSRLLDDAKRTASALPSRSKLAPLHEAIVYYRAGGFSYERIAGSIVRQGLKVSHSCVATYCRNHISRTELDRARRAIEASKRSSGPPVQIAGIGNAPALGAFAPARIPTPRSGRGPNIARDDY